MSEDLTTLTFDQFMELLRSCPLADRMKLASPWMDPEETAAYLGIALGTLRNWTSAHFVPFCKKGRVVRYHREAIDKWLAKGGCIGRSTFADLSR